jgi:hypothetical protein
MPMMGGGNNKTSEARSNSLDSGGNKGKKSFFSR